MKIRVRYDQPDENGITRRFRNEDFEHDHLTPDYELDFCALFYFDLYFRISDRLQRVKDGCCSPIEPVQFQAWLALTNSVVYPWEYDMLGEMDLAFCQEMNAEIEAYQQRQADKSKISK